MRARTTTSARERASAAAADIDRQPVSTRRLEGFTDGVFAIAATLLVLDMSTADFGRIASERDLVDALVAIAPSVLNVAISFLLLGLLWSIHVRQFEHIVRVDGALIWLNTLRLLGVVLVPFVTSLNDDFSDYLAGRMALPVVFLAVVVLSAWQWFYASAPGRGFLDDMSEVLVHNSRVNAVTAVAIATAVVALSSLIGSFAFLLFALDPVISQLLRHAGIVRDASPGSEPPAARG
ncbi:TMEM175 family protein [Cryobacterium tepidiphilum]|uniref:DUF1211 domain-containing protein n=1 Tax=Cryobacterium tepidiphilum TaxID=2486026 RepID=A0A3M8LMN5_9MICO|nr:TMEM175 family protein [Cryobacterium tepidiphilum]RNE66605.1 DUF1211 domain-containing protein [Cryobacterium tepidiphilum]